MPGDPAHRAATLLVTLLDADELRRWIARHYPEIVPLLPHTRASHVEIAHFAVDAVDRLGHLNETFFDRLREERPHRTAEIETVAAVFRADRAHRRDRPVLAESPGRRPGIDRRLVVGLVIALVAIITARIQCVRTGDIRASHESTVIVDGGCHP